jgi:hypothetical protein
MTGGTYTVGGVTRNVPNVLVTGSSAQDAAANLKAANPVFDPSTGRYTVTSTASYGWQYGTPGQAAIASGTSGTPLTVTTQPLVTKPPMYAYQQGSARAAVQMATPGRQIIQGAQPAQPASYYLYQPGKQTRTDIQQVSNAPRINVGAAQPVTTSQPVSQDVFGEKFTSGLNKAFDVVGWQFRNAPGAALFGFERFKNVGMGVASLGTTTLADPLGTPERLAKGTLGYPGELWEARTDIGKFTDVVLGGYVSGKIISRTVGSSPIKPEVSKEGIGLKLGYENIPRLSREGFKYGQKIVPLVKFGETTLEVPTTKTGTAFLIKSLETKYPEVEVKGGKAGLEVIAGAYPSKGISFESTAFEQVQPKTFSVKENAAIKELIRAEAKTGNVMVGGSTASKIEGVLARESKDWDIYVKNPQEFAAKGLTALQAVGKGTFRLQGNIVEKFITTEAGNKQFVHGLDIHGFPEGYGAAETLGYGYGKKTPLKVENIQLLNPGEQAARKGISALTPREAEFAPEPHRLKDIGDFVTISEKLIKEGDYPFKLGGLARPYSLTKLAEYKSYLKGKGIELGEGGEVLFAELKGTKEKSAVV